MALFNTLRKPLLKLSEKREAKQQRINEYKSLLSLMSSTGMVVYEGVPYRSIADFTIDFFKN